MQFILNRIFCGLCDVLFPVSAGSATPSYYFRIYVDLTWRNLQILPTTDIRVDQTLLYCPVFESNLEKLQYDIDANF